jgi:hypothetical protein
MERVQGLSVRDPKMHCPKGECFYMLSLMYASCCISIYYPFVTVSTQHHLTLIHIYV